MDIHTNNPLRPLILAVSSTPILSAPAQGGLERWERVGPPGGGIEQVMVTPSAPGFVYAFQVFEVLRSSDGETRFQGVSPGLGEPFARSLAWTVVEAAGQARVFQTTDGGARRANRHRGLPDGIRGLAVDPALRGGAYAFEP